MPRSPHGGRHELGQNHLTHRPTITRFVDLAGSTTGAIIEIGAGSGALTGALAALGRPLTAIDIDEHRVSQLRRTLPGVRIECADALHHPLDAAVVVGNIPFHLTTPILRRLLTTGTWEHAVLLTQWEVARKRAGVGGSTMMTAQAAPWFAFELHGRVPSWAFSPRPAVDGGILGITRRSSPLLPRRERPAYERFVRAVFVGRGTTMDRIVQHAAHLSAGDAVRAVRGAGVASTSRPRDLDPYQWARLWASVRRRAPSRRA